MIKFFLYRYKIYEKVMNFPLYHRFKSCKKEECSILTYIRFLMECSCFLWLFPNQICSQYDSDPEAFFCYPWLRISRTYFFFRMVSLSNPTSPLLYFFIFLPELFFNEIITFFLSDF